MNGSEVLEAFEGAIRSVAERVGPAVVGVGHGWGQGSGVLVGDGIVLTNAHNVRGDGDPPEVEVRFGDGRRAVGRVAASDVDGDLAVIGVDTGGIAVPEWSDGSGGIGTVVFALANPGGRGLRVTAGAVSAVNQSFRGPRGRRIPGGLEHTAPLPPGSSGGPVVDAHGRLLGLNTHRLGEGFYLARPADAELRARVDSLARGEVHRRVQLGVAVAPPEVARKLRRAVGLEPRDGLLVRAVGDGSPAAEAGIDTGDLIVAVGGRDVAGTDDLFEALDAAGGTVAVRVVRGTDEIELEVRLSAPR